MFLSLLLNNQLQTINFQLFWKQDRGKMRYKKDIEHFVQFPLPVWWLFIPCQSFSLLWHSTIIFLISCLPKIITSFLILIFLSLIAFHLYTTFSQTIGIAILHACGSRGIVAHYIPMMSSCRKRCSNMFHKLLMLFWTIAMLQLCVRKKLIFFYLKSFFYFVDLPFNMATGVLCCLDHNKRLYSSFSFEVLGCACKEI